MSERIRIFLSRFIATFRHKHLDVELEDELAFHIEMQTRENLRKGMNPEEARCSARRSLGGLDQIKEKYRDRRSLRLIEDFARDIRCGLRMLRRNPGFALAAVITLALGIGANTAVFSVVNAVLLRPLPFDRPHEIVQIKHDSGNNGITPILWQPEFLAFQRHSVKVSEIAAYNIGQSNLSGKEGAKRITIGRVSESFFPLLGVQPQIGRSYLPADEQAGGQVVILSNGLWKGHFGSDPAVIGRSLLLDGKTYLVIGILPPSFEFPDSETIDVWTLLNLKENDKYHQQLNLYLLGRLGPSTQIQVAQAELDSIYQWARSRSLKGHVVLVRWEDEITREARLPLLMFLGTAGFVLLIAGSNVANLLLARVSTREKEIAIRAAIGGRRLRILRQLLTESLLIALLGGSLGFALTFWARDPLRLLVARNLVHISSIPIDVRVLGFTLLISIVLSVAVGIVPALQTAAISLSESIKDGNRSSTRLRSNLIQKAFIIIEVGLVAALLIGAGLLLRSLLSVRQINPGFRPERILNATVDLTLNKYPDPHSQAAYFECALDRIKNIPSVQSAAASATLPLGGFTVVVSGIVVEGSSITVPDEGPRPYVLFSSVSADYFRTMGIPLIHGRAFTEHDREGSADVAVIDDAFMHRYSPDRNPIGRRIRNPFKKNDWLTIVGVVGSVHQYGVEKESDPMVYTSYLQPGFEKSRMGIVIRCAHDPMKLAAPVRDMLRSLDPDQPAFEMMTLEERLSRSLYTRKTNSFLVGSFAVLALLLACVGIYGVVSYSVNQRTHEIGVRIALGARQIYVLWMVVKEAMRTCLIGLLFGIAGALATTHLISSLLYGVKATDALTFITASLFVIAVAFVAAYIPAHRAATADPARSLRYE